MKTLDQINSEILASVDARIKEIQNTGLLTMSENNNESEVRAFYTGREISLRISQLLEVAATLEEYLRYISLDGNLERQLLRDKMKKLLAEFNS